MCGGGACDFGAGNQRNPSGFAAACVLLGRAPGVVHYILHCRRPGGALKCVHEYLTENRSAATTTCTVMCERALLLLSFVIAIVDVFERIVPTYILYYTYIYVCVCVCIYTYCILPARGGLLYGFPFRAAQQRHIIMTSHSLSIFILRRRTLVFETATSV